MDFLRKTGWSIGGWVVTAASLVVGRATNKNLGGILGLREIARCREGGHDDNNGEDDGRNNIWYLLRGLGMLAAMKLYGPDNTTLFKKACDSERGSTTDY